MTQDDVASRVGKGRSSVTNTLRLLNLAPKVQKLLIEGDLSAGHGRALLAVEIPAEQMTVARRVIDEECPCARPNSCARWRRSPSPRLSPNLHES
ncbi:MAG: hypothetical protein IH940_00420 [Acidobacteria bacterium]|nr:hypothetical protein [Acidobacteriota bacterium]